ncbi:hypothetical protein, partial [Xanthomonas phaseoli]|uniref:hypothetical protein n=2 Tax=Xanthomonas phaseoli TaxID=1985254 RepID=UPI001ED8C6EE
MPIVHTDFLRGTCAGISLAQIPSNESRQGCMQPAKAADGRGRIRFVIRHPSSVIRHPSSANPEFRIPNSESRIPNSEFR